MSRKTNIEINRLFNLIGLCMCLILLNQCANKLSIEGGAKDEKAPELDVEKSDKNFQTNFDSREFALYFDEFVELDNPGEQIIISPPLRYSLTPIARGKKIIFKFHPEEELSPNTTYSVQFGESIKDITEKNPIQNLRYVLATGDKIDSMQVRVFVRNLTDGAPVEGAFVMLYETLSDTVIRTGKPVYFSKSDSSGLAIVKNTRPGKYRIISLKDENRNYQLDNAEEQIGYLDTFISSSINPATTYTIHMYSELTPPRLSSINKIDSLLYACTIDGETDYINWKAPGGSKIEMYKRQDTVYLYTREEIPYVILENMFLPDDTIQIASLRVEQDANNPLKNVLIKSYDARKIGGRIYVNMVVSGPVSGIDLNKFKALNKDSVFVKLTQIELDSSFNTAHNINVTYDSRGLTDSILLEKGAVSSWRFENDDTILPLRPIGSSSLSNLIVEIDDLDPATSYLLKLKNDRGVVINELTIKGEMEYTWMIPGLFPKKHTLDLISDLNNNGIRDGGFFDLRMIPEPIVSQEINKLRPDWDVQIDVQPTK